jgi:hypothetical protein
MIAVGSICLLGSATTAELTGAEIQEFISGTQSIWHQSRAPKAKDTRQARRAAFTMQTYANGADAALSPSWSLSDIIKDAGQ